MLKLRCAACRKLYPRNEWTSEQLKKANPEKQGSKLVCKSCRAAGCTADDPTYYTCKLCQREKGCKMFDSGLLHNYKTNDRSKLNCLSCEQENAERIRILHGKFKMSKWFCKCGNPIHSEKCPLATMCYDKRRWPGGDGYITAEDYVFLCTLNPRPKWWTHALRKPK